MERLHRRINYNYLWGALILVLASVFIPGDSYNQEMDVMKEPSIDKNAVNDRRWGYLVDHGRVVLRGMKGEKIQFVSWIAGNDGYWKEHKISEKVEIDSEFFIIPADTKPIFWSDMRLLELYGQGFQSISIALMVINADTNKVIDQKTWSIGVVRLGRRTVTKWQKGKTTDERIISKYYPWSARKHPEALLQPVHRKIYNKPIGNKYFSISYGIRIPEIGNIISIRYLDNGNRMLVSDDNSFLYMLNLNSQEVIWKRQAVPGSNHPLFIYDVSHNGRYFITGHKLLSTKVEDLLFFHRTSDGRIIRKINEQSDYIDKSGTDTRGEPMRCTSAQFYNTGTKILAFWTNDNESHGKFDLSMKSYSARSGKQVWEWQVQDRDGIDSGNREYNRDIKIVHLEKITGKSEHFHLFSKTGKAYFLTPLMIKKGMMMLRVDDKPTGTYIYTLPNLISGECSLKGLAPSAMQGMHWMTYTDDAGEGTASLFNITTGDVINRTVFPMKYDSIMTGVNGRYFVATGDKHLYVWDTQTKYMVLNLHEVESLAFHPKVREIALVWQKKEIRFAIERPRMTFTLDDIWKEIDLYAGPDTCLFAYSMDVGVRFGMHMQEDKPRKTIDGGYIVLQGMMPGSGLWSGWLTETGEKGTKLVVKSGGGIGKLEVWGGFSSREWKLSREQLRKNLKGW